MNFDLVSDQILTANKITKQNIFSFLSDLYKVNIHYADIYFQSSFNESWILENKIIRNGSSHIDQGVGVRSISGDKTGFSYTNQINLPNIRQSVEITKNIIKYKKNNNTDNLLQSKLYVTSLNKMVYQPTNPLNSMSPEDKISLLKHIDKIARAENSYVTKVNISLSGLYDQILIASTDGTLSADIRPLVRILIDVVVEKDGKRERGYSGGGARSGYEFFLNKENGDLLIDVWAKDAVRMALINLSADPAPAGTMPVILGSGWPGIMLHEAVGHGLEGDFNRKGTSVFKNQIGSLVASNLCTVVDDATIEDVRGSLNIDDEGVPGQYNILIENGILKQYMQDKLNARLMNNTSTGNGRRESYAHIPMPRMTNTYMLPGKSTVKEMIESIEFGIYALNFSGGQVDITSGKFVFSTSEAYIIKNGKIIKPIKNATLIGSGLDTMKHISMIGNDLSFDKGIGICVKDGQSIPVGVGQPTLKVDQITVGGTE